MRVRKVRKGCERCADLKMGHDETPARWRTYFECYLCEACYALAMAALAARGEDQRGRSC